MSETETCSAGEAPAATPRGSRPRFCGRCHRPLGLPAMFAHVTVLGTIKVMCPCGGHVVIRPEGTQR